MAPKKLGNEAATKPSEAFAQITTVDADAAAETGALAALAATVAAPPAVDFPSISQNPPWEGDGASYRGHGGDGSRCTSRATRCASTRTTATTNDGDTARRSRGESDGSRRGEETGRGDVEAGRLGPDVGRGAIGL